MVRAYVKDYPRPQLVRDNWVNLNGTWAFLFDDENRGEKEKWYLTFPEGKEIVVPFTYETKLSGIGDEGEHNYVWYKREFTLDPSAEESDRRLMHFEGSDYLTKVWINGSFAGEHRGGYSRFSFDITDLLETEINTIVVRVEDSFDTDQPRGKQRWVKENFACWYVQTTGIWKTVWLETVPQTYLTNLKLTPDLNNSEIKVETLIADLPADHALDIEALVSYKGRLVNTITVPAGRRGNSFSIPLRSTDVTPFGIALWFPENPELYDLEIRLVKEGKTEDKVLSYFGMREIKISEGQILLNNRPLYQRLILDQGYWKDSHLTPPNEEALIADIDKIHQLGFNGLRKHQKIEDERFLFWCDVKGMLVWSEFPAAYTFSDRARDMMMREWMDIVKQNYNHPSIITWTPFNESWGVPNIHKDKQEQQFTEAIYYLTKSFDPMRPVILNDGWEHTISDILTLHDYVEAGSELTARYKDQFSAITENKVYFNKHQKAFAEGYHYKGQPIIMSEYGGIAFNNGKDGWGYGNKVGDEAAFLDRYDAVTTAIQEIPYFVGFCYTQVTDVQQEINGLMDMERNFKVDPAAIRRINERKS